LTILELLDMHRELQLVNPVEIVKGAIGQRRYRAKALSGKGAMHHHLVTTHSDAKFLPLRVFEKNISSGVEIAVFTKTAFPTLETLTRAQIMV
jgi:hypothetical protein